MLQYEPHARENVDDARGYGEASRTTLLAETRMLSPIRLNKTRSKKGAWLKTGVLISVTISLAAVCFVVLGFMLAENQQPQPIRPRESCYCGESVVEARELYDCTFDILAAAWLPSYCRNDSLTQEFRTAGPNGEWLYYADHNMTRQVSELEISMMADDRRMRFHTSWEWHVMHCLYNWQKQVYSYQNPELLTMEARYSPIRHARHCTKILAGGKHTVSGVALDSTDWRSLRQKQDNYG